MVQNIFASREAKKHTSKQTTSIFNLQVLGKTDDFAKEIRQNKLEEEANKHITKMLELLNNLGFNTPVDGSAKKALNSMPPGSLDRKSVV